MSFLNQHKIILIPILAMIMVMPVHAQINFVETGLAESSPFDDFFETDEPLHIALEFDHKELNRNRESEDYVDGRLIYASEDSSFHHFNIRVKTRGTLRKSYCSLPPFWLNINHSGIPSNELDGTKKIKIVTHCMKPSHYQDYVLKEYLAYKVYNLISPYSFRVRLLRITYIDTGRRNKTAEGWAIALEPLEMLASRLNATIMENDKLGIVMMNTGVMTRLSVYHYMMGNTDWSITGMHNTKFLMLNGNGPQGYIPVPYDFDYTGFVNTDYSKPASQVPISKTTQRYFVGPCIDENRYLEVLSEFRDLSEGIHDMLQTFPHMSMNQKLEMLRFTEKFFDEITATDFYPEKILPSCK